MFSEPVGKGLENSFYFSMFFPQAERADFPHFHRLSPLGFSLNLRTFFDVVICYKYSSCQAFVQDYLSLPDSLLMATPSSGEVSDQGNGDFFFLIDPPFKLILYAL
jgi:hypothetical protein